LASPTGKSPAAIAAPDVTSRFDARFSLQPANNPDLVQSAKLMIPAPPQTELALQGADPRLLQASFQRGLAAMRSNYSDMTTNDGVRLVNMVASLGYQPARVTIVQEYPKSPLIRATVKSAEAIRYSLDPLIITGAQSESNRAFLVLLAAYFSGHQELKGYATGLLTALLDDRRLQVEDRLNTLLDLLTRVHGVCTALAFAVTNARTVTGPECASGLKLRLQNFLRVTAPPRAESESRRQALQLLQNRADLEHRTAGSNPSD
jgi:hypothetical protein